MTTALSGANTDLIPKIVVMEKSGFSLMARIEGEDGTPITQSTISTITMFITQRPSLTVITPPAIVVADVIFDTLQTDDRWPTAAEGGDDTGYNFRHFVDGREYLQTGQSLYRIEYDFVPVTAGQEFTVPFDVATKEVFGAVA